MQSLLSFRGTGNLNNIYKKHPPIGGCFFMGHGFGLLLNFNGVALLYDLPLWGFYRTDLLHTYHFTAAL